MKTLHYSFVTLLFSVLIVNLFAQGNMTIQGGGAVTVNGNLNITQTWSCGQPITDTRDGKIYNTVLIGNQCWFSQNLNVGNKIIVSQTNNGVLEKYCYNNDENNCNIYGGIYLWDEAMQYSLTPGVQGMCPDGWHFPTDEEWTTLVSNLGGESVAGGMMKSTGNLQAGTGLWYYSANGGATNSSGFTAHPAGYADPTWGWTSLGTQTFWWSSTDFNNHSYVWARSINYDAINIVRGFPAKVFGFSVRCLRN